MLNIKNKILNILSLETIGGFIFSFLLMLLHIYGDVTVYEEELSVLLIIKNIIWLLVYYFVFCLFKYLLSKDRFECYKLNVINYKLYHFLFDKKVIRTTAILFICWLPHLIMKYPVGLHMDTYWEIAMSQYNSYGHYALFHILLIGYVYKLGQLLGNVNVVMFAYNTITAFIEALVFSFGLKKIDEVNCPKWIINLGIIFLAINPLVAGYIATTTKDVNYSYYVFCFVALLIQYVLDRNLFFKQKINIVMLFISCLFICLFRSNGVYLVVPTITYFIIKEFINFKDYKKIIILVLVMLLPIISEKKLEKVYNFEKPGVAEALSVPINQTARFIRDHKDLVTEEEKEILERYIPFECFGDLYVPTSADATKAIFNASSLGDCLDYFKVWFAEFFKAPDCYVEVLLDQDIYILYPRYNETKYYIDCNDYYVDPSEQDTGFFQTPSIIKDNQYYYTSLLYVQHEIPVYQLTTNIASFNILFLYTLIITLGKKKLKMMLPLIPLVLSFLVSVVAPCVLSNGRYSFPIAYCFPLWLYIAYCSLKNEHIKK